jgi:hypothetical protein
MIEWFAANKLILNLEKTNVMKFVTKNLPHCVLTIGYKDKYIEEVVNTKFLGIHLDNHLNWKDHTDQIIPKLSAACYTIRQMYHFVNQHTLKSIYFTYFHSFVKYGIIFWGNVYMYVKMVGGRGKQKESHIFFYSMQKKMFHNYRNFKNFIFKYKTTLFWSPPFHFNVTIKLLALLSSSSRKKLFIMLSSFV